MIKLNFLKEEIKLTDELPVIRAKVNAMKSFANELKSVKASADKANEVGKKVLGNHSASKDVETKIAKMKDLFESTEKLEKEKVEKLDKAVKFFRRNGSKISRIGIKNRQIKLSIFNCKFTSFRTNKL